MQPKNSIFSTERCMFHSQVHPQQLSVFNPLSHTTEVSF